MKTEPEEIQSTPHVNAIVGDVGAKQAETPPPAAAPVAQHPVRVASPSLETAAAPGLLDRDTKDVVGEKQVSSASPSAARRAQRAIRKSDVDALRQEHKGK